MGKIVDMNGKEIMSKKDLSKIIGPGGQPLQPDPEPELELPDNVVHVAYEETGQFYPFFIDNDYKKLKKMIQDNRNHKKKAGGCHFGCQTRINFMGYKIYAILFPDGDYFDARSLRWTDYVKANNMDKYRFQAQFAQHTAQFVNVLKYIKKLDMEDQT